MDRIRFYTASSFQNIQDVNYLNQRLVEKGYELSYDWTQNGRASSLAELSVIGEEEMQGVRNADFLIVLLPGGKGSHIEMGMALGLRKRVYLFSPEDRVYELDSTSTFYHVSLVSIYVGELNDFIQTF
ncbi:nucleoside 2-deoxyribosyltransferase [Peribacillus sp. FSL H8-0477]|uniref:nucleoside 2-deoxyribosyltransferase n=1 Tax=Peribacillus sp. FSL H8-0477 TaxID=2921388 RepID=UPI0030F9E217